MKPQELKYFKKLLNERIDELIKGAGRTVSEMAGEEEVFADPNDRASQESERNLELRIRERERKLIQDEGSPPADRRRHFRHL